MHCCWMQTGAATMGDSMEVPPKIKSSSTSGYLSEEIQNTNLKRYMHAYVHCSIIYNSQAMEATQVPINRQVDKKAVVHIYNEILAIKKNEILSFLTIWINVEGIIFSEISQRNINTI